MLGGQIALVTGASRGIGRGIALQLGEAGATVYITGRPLAESDTATVDDQLPTLEKTAQEITARGGKGIAVYCDHSKPEEIEKLFARIEKETDGHLDILVNNAYAAVNDLLQSAGKKYWELEPSIFDRVNNVGLRNHYHCAVLATRMMVKRDRGLIVNVSSAGGLRFLFNVAYGVGKQACDRMMADMAIEGRSHNICCISLWPGAVKTELVTTQFLDKPDTEDSIGKGLPASLRTSWAAGETTEYSGVTLAAFAADPQRMRQSGRVLITADLGRQYGLKDIDGRVIQSLRSLKGMLRYSGHTWMAAIVPSFIMVPGWVLAAATTYL